MVKNNCCLKSKFGFSLMEACVVMLIAAIFITIIANVVSRRVSRKSMAVAHGRFECYYDGGKLYQEKFNDGASTTGGRVEVNTGSHSSKIKGQTVTRNYCEFEPDKYAKYYILNVVGSGGKATSTTGGNAGKFSSSFVPPMQTKYWLFPGKAPSTTTSPTDVNSYVTKPGNTAQAGDVLIIAPGAGSIDWVGTSTDDITECSFLAVTDQENYLCGSTPSCQLINGKVVIKHCVNQEKQTSITLNISDLEKSSKCQAHNLYKNGVFRTAYDLGKTGSALDEMNENCDYTAIMNNPWVYEPESGSLIYPDVYLPLKVSRMLPHKFYNRMWAPSLTDSYAPSLYTMLLTKDVDADDSTGAKSKMATMAEAFEYTVTLKSAGNGGTEGSSTAHPGAIVVTW